MAEYFKDIPKIKYEGVNSANPLSFKYYNPDEVVMGKTMRKQLKFALSWWHTMGGDGTDMFGCGTTDKTWGEAAPEARAKKKVDVAFEIMTSFLSTISASMTVTFLLSTVISAPLTQSLLR